MKSVKEIQKIISRLSEQVKENENKGSRLFDEAKKLAETFSGKWKEITNDPDFEKWKAISEESDKAYMQASEIEKVIVVWKFNLLHAKKAELLPIWANVMKEYEGKQIGETRKKEIHDKLKALGITGYFSKYEYSSPKISLSFLDNNGCCYGSDYIELTGNYSISFFDDNNKFVMPELSSFKFYGEDLPYIENPKKYIKQLTSQAEKVRKSAEAFDKVITEYNNAVIPGFRRIDCYKDTPNSISKYFRITL